MTLPIWTQSIHHDGSAVFVSNPLPTLNETITISLRIPTDAPLSVVYFRAMLNGEFHYQAMTASEHSTDAVTYWECEVTVSQTYVNYMFMLGTDDGALYYSAQGMSFGDYPDSDWFVLLADYDAPIWVRDEVYYQIFPERFHNGDPSNDVVDNEYERRGFPAIKREWGEKPYPWKKAGSMDFFGGDLQGITQKLDYLAELGITGIYTTPIFSAESNHKYDITDFFHVDSHFGGDEALVELRQASRERNMSIMLDITPNHCSYNHPWVTEFKNHPLDGDTSEFFYYDEETDAFATWLGVPSLIKLNYGSQRLRDVMYRNEESAIRKWLQAPFSIDAWRLDVANMTGNQDSDQLDHEVWREMREYARQDNDKVYLLGEYFQDGTPHLQGDELDASMNYQGFNMPMRRWLVPSEKQVIETDNPHHYKPSIPAEVMAEQWQRFMGKIAYPIALQQFNQLDSHDTTRVLHETFGDKALVQLGTALMLAFPGVPCIYYGTEIGLDGAGDPDNRRPMIWNEDEWDTDMLTFFQTAIRARKDSHALKNGGLEVLHAEGDTVAFMRQSTEETVIVIGHRGDNSLTNFALSVDALGITDDTVFTDLLSDTTVTVKNGTLIVPDIVHGQCLMLSSVNSA